jgi:RNase P protein component
MQTSIPRGGNLAQRTHRAQLVQLGLLRHRIAKLLREAFLERDGERDEQVSGVVLVNPGFDFREPVRVE